MPTYVIHDRGSGTPEGRDRYTITTYGQTGSTHSTHEEFAIPMELLGAIPMWRLIEEFGHRVNVPMIAEDRPLPYVVADPDND